MQGKRDGFRNVLDGQGLAYSLRVAAGKELGKIHLERRVAPEQISLCLCDVLHIGEDRQVTHLAVAAALTFGYPSYSKDRMVERSCEGHVIDSRFARCKVELHLHLLDGLVRFCIIDLQYGLALLPLLRSVADAGGQSGLVSITEEAGQRQLGHQLLLCNDGFLPPGRHHVLRVCQAVQMP